MSDKKSSQEKIEDYSPVYREDSRGAKWQRVSVCINVRGLHIYGIGSTKEEAAANAIAHMKQVHATN